MSPTLPVNSFERVKEIFKCNEGFIESYNEESGERFFLEVDIQYSEKLHELHNDMLLLRETMKINKVKKHVANLHI